MKRTCIGIYGRESEYIRKLAGYIRRRCGDKLEVKAFTKKETLEMCLEEGGLDCVLSEMEGASLCEKYEIWTALLSEDRQEAAGRICIEKYQSAEQIWKQFLKVGGEQLKGIHTLALGMDEEPVFIGVASPLHGCGKTSLGLYISRILGEKERVLFLTLDEFSCLPEILGEGSVPAELSELYYYYSQGELSDLRLQSAVCRWGETEYLVPAGAPGDLYRDGKPYEAGFFRNLAQAGGYRYLVIDLGNSLFQKEELFELCGRVYVPEGESPESLIRLEFFFHWLEDRELSGRAVRCRIPKEPGKGRMGNLRLAFLSESGMAVRKLLQRDGFLSGEAG